MAKYGTFKYGTAKYGTSGGEESAKYIFDRTEEDLRNNTSKAYMNYYDLNRIESRMRDLRIILNSLGYIVRFSTYTGWKNPYEAVAFFPTLKEMKRIHNNEKLLMDASFVYDTTPKLPENIENLTIYNVNDMEKILYDLNLIAKSIQDTTVYSGTIECGEWS